MGETTHISWADATFNPWVGCTKVSAACDGCYAEHMMATRMGRVTWGAPGQGAGTREMTSAANWRKPLAWDRAAAKAIDHWRSNPFALNETPKPKTFVFCASLADVFDNEVPAEWRSDLFDLIHATPNLTWLLLTKRPQNIERLWFKAHGSTPWPKNAAIGCTVVTQAEAERDIPVLLSAKMALSPAFAFVSMEPLLGPVDLTGLTPETPRAGWFNALTGERSYQPVHADHGIGPKLDWVITGGETDQGTHKARPSHPDWFRQIRDDCAAAGVAYHHKQNGEWAPGEHCPDLRARDCASLFDGAWEFDRVPAGPSDDHIDDEPHVYRIGKKAAGRMLDGVVHDARPAL